MLKLWGYMSRSIEKPYKAYRSNCLVYEYLFGSGAQNIQEYPNPDTFAQLLSQKLIDLEDYNVMIVDFFMYLEKPIRRSEA